MKTLLVITMVVVLAAGAYADTWSKHYTWPKQFPYDGLVTKDRAGLPLTPNAIHLNGGFFYVGILNKYFDTDGDSLDDRHTNYALGFPLDIGYTFNGKWEVGCTLQVIKWSRTEGVDQGDFGIGDMWIKGRKLFQAGEDFWVGPRIAGKIQLGDSHRELGDGQGDIDAGAVFAKYGDSRFKLNGQAGFRYSLEDSDIDIQPGMQMYTFLEPGFGIGGSQKFIIYAPVGFGYHMESKRNDVGMDDSGYGFTVGVKPAFALSDNHTINFTLLYPVFGKNANQELYVAVTTDSFIPIPKPVGDADGDGIKDNVDACPNEPEDFDGFEDSDGCPELDNDGDGILDTDDKCPNQPENFNGYEDEDGCPDEKPEWVPPKFDTIRFNPDSTKPLEGYYTVLDKAGAKLMEDPKVKITLAGHAADTGRPDFEMKLSEGRAAFVKDYHVKKHGMDPNRIAIVYYGSTRPIADNSTEEGKSQNRRVEYIVEK
jgi:outer membrane protein OmpA-like peptidoglycan-associated protein/opacity protein-like surface antigen